MYGNYDGLNNAPQFDIYLGVNIWDTIKLDNGSSTVTTEIISVPSTNFIFVCLFNTGHGTPLISSLELRLLNSSTYTTLSPSDESLIVLQQRLDVGSTTNQPVR